MSSEQIRPNLLTVVPGNINIENFVPGRQYKEILMIYNTCNIPIVINLKSSDKNKLSISESKMRIGVNQSKKLDLLIQDKLNYKYTKTPIKHKKLFIHMKGELIDEKYEINLFYYHKNKNLNNQNANYITENPNNPNLINHQRIDISNKYLINNSNKIKNGYLTENPNNYLNQERININQMNNYDLNNNFENKNNSNIPFQKNNIINNIDPNSLMPIGKNDNEEIVGLKNIINDLLIKMNNLKPLLDHYHSNKIYNNNTFTIEHNSLYIFGDNNEKEIKEKYKLDQNVDNERILSRNKILELENSTLLYRIKCLEKKLSLYENKSQNYTIFNKNTYKINNENLENYKINENNIYLNNKNEKVKPNYHYNYINENEKFLNNNKTNNIINRNNMNSYFSNKNADIGIGTNILTNIFEKKKNNSNKIPLSSNLESKSNPIYNIDNKINENKINDKDSS